MKALLKTLNRALNESEHPKKKVVFIFGRMNPPTKGHDKLIKVAQDEAKKQGADLAVYLTKTQDKKKNPLSFEEKQKILLKSYPEKIVKTGNYNTIFDVLVDLYNQGYTDITMVAGSDRVKEFEILINKYNGVPARHGEYAFDIIQVKNAGERDPDKDDVSGLSATKVREYALNDDLVSFKNGIMNGDKMSDKEIKTLMALIRKRLGK